MVRNADGKQLEIICVVSVVKSSGSVSECKASAAASAASKVKGEGNEAYSMHRVVGES